MVLACAFIDLTVLLIAAFAVVCGVIAVGGLVRSWLR